MKELNSSKVIENGKRVIGIEASSIAGMQEQVGEEFAEAVKAIFNSNGRVVLTGLGKSGLIARKIVATLNSTGTAAIYLHPTDAMHGDLGMVRKEDVIILLSKSGNTEELLHLITMLRRIGVLLIGMLGNTNSKLAKEVDIILNVEVREEACPFDLAPTASSTAALVMGDALSVALLQERGFTEDDFAMLHPGGSLGKRLSLKISEIMIKDDEVPLVKESTSLKDTIIEMTTKRLGMTCVVNDEGVLQGIITDGDLRRLLERTMELSGLTAGEVMTRDPKVISSELLASFALQHMENHKITTLIVAGDDRKPVGIVHMHSLIDLGLRQR